MNAVEYHRPATIEAAVALKAKHGDDARFWAGGTDLYLLQERRGLRFGHCIDLSGIAELTGIARADDGAVRVGAMASLAEIERFDWGTGAHVVLAETARLMCTPQTRTLATVGGNMCHAAPSADLSPPLIAVGAIAEIAGSGGRRSVPLDEFFVGVNRTALQDGELLAALTLPATVNGACSYRRVARTVVDIALVSSSVSITLGEDRRISGARIVLGAVAPTPIRAREAEAILTGVSLADLPGASDGVADAAAAASKPITDIRGSDWYRRRMCGVLTARALKQCAETLGGDA